MTLGVVSFLLVVWWGSSVHVIHWTRKPSKGSRLDDRGPSSLITKFCTFEWMYSCRFQLLTLFSPVLPCFRSGTFEHGTLLKGNLILPCGAHWQVLDLNILAWVALAVDVILTSTFHNSNWLSPKLRLNFKATNLLLNQQLATQAQSHIQHLQQTMPAHPQPFANHPTAATTIHVPSATFYIHSCTFGSRTTTCSHVHTISNHWRAFQEDECWSQRGHSFLFSWPSWTTTSGCWPSWTSWAATSRHFETCLTTPSTWTFSSTTSSSHTGCSPSTGNHSSTSTSSATFYAWGPSAKPILRSTSTSRHPDSNTHHPTRSRLRKLSFASNSSSSIRTPSVSFQTMPGFLPDHVALLSMSGPGQNVLTNGPFLFLGAPEFDVVATLAPVILGNIHGPAQPIGLVLPTSITSQVPFSTTLWETGAV